ncbi:MAG: hypothetical protein A2X08_10845 [Bacteroidetes bacterium GWA2_32_17]|nr:MAG: hypothetical protein A2X08_10845 [Bacteroidetes bacterium GWA2_32_17]
MKMKKGYILIFITLFSVQLVGQTTYYSSISGNWDNVASWSTVGCGGVAAVAFPVAGDNVIICNGNTIFANVNSACKDITLQGTGILNFPSNGITLNASGNLVMNGTSRITGNSNTRILNIGGTLSVTAGSSVILGGIQINVTGIATLDGTLTCSDNTGTKNFSSDFNVTSTGALSFAQAETYTIAGNLNMTNGSSIGETAAVTGVLTVAGKFNVLNGSGSVGVGRASLTISDSTIIDGTLLFTVSAAGNKSFRNINISATGTWNNTIGEDPRINGNIVNNGNWLGPIGGTADYQFGRTVGGSYTISGNPVVFSRMSIYNNTIVTNLGTVIINGNVNPGIRRSSGTCIFNNGDGVASAVLYLENSGGADGVAAPGNNLTFNASFLNNTVYYTRGGNQNIRIPDDNCYYNLICGVSGTKTVQAGTTGIRNMLYIKDAAIVNVGANTLNDGCGGSGNLTMTDNSQLLIAKCDPAVVPELTGTYTLTGGTISLNGACNQTWNSVPAGANTVYNLILTNSGAKCIGGITTINGDLSISGTATMTCNGAINMDCSRTFNYNSTGTTTLANNISLGNFSQTAGTFDDGGFNITICGSSFARSAGTYTATGRVIFDGSTTVSGASITTFNNVTINPTKTLIAHLTNINITGTDFTNNGTFTHNNGTVTFTTASVKSILGSSESTFNNLTISAGTLIGHSVNMNIEGTWTNNSTYTHNSGKVTFVGANAQNLAGTSATTFFVLEINKSVGTILTQTVATTSVSNLLTMLEGVFNVQTNTLDGTGNFTANGGDLQLARITTVPQLTGTYSVTGGTVTLNGAGAQTLNTASAGASTYYNLVFSTSGAKTITGLLTINGDVTVSGTATITANSAFIQAATKSFNYLSSGLSTMNAATAFTVGSYVQSAGTFNTNNNNMTVSGDVWNKTGGTFSATNGRVIFAGSAVQTFTHNANNFANVTINNVNGLQLNNNISIVTDLTFTSGNIITGANNVILTSNATTVTGASQITGFVDGNLQKYISTSPKTFEIGSGGNYVPINYIFVGITAGNLICSTTASDHSDIFASDIDPNKTVNRYWTIDFSTLVVATFDATFNYSAGEVDAIADPTAFGMQRYDAVNWTNLTISGIPTSTQTIITGATPTTSNDYIIGERFNPNGLYNAVTGAMNWNNSSNWIRYRTGTISSTLGNPVITGGGTIFTTEIIPGDIILIQSNPGVQLGTVSTVDNDGQITLTAGATATSVNASFGIRALPDVNDEVNIGNPFIAGAAVDVTLDVSGVTIYRLIFTRMAFSNTLTHSGGNELNITGNVNIKQPTSANTNSWNIDAGTATAGGNITIGSNVATANYISKINLTTGTISIGTNLIFSSPVAANAVMDLSGGAATVNLSGNFMLTNAGSYRGTFTPGASSTFNYNKNSAGQTVNLTTVAPAVTYCNLHLNNTDATGATIITNITTTNVTGNLRVQSGLFNNGGFAIAGNGTRTFSVDNGATFQMNGTAVFPTGFGTFTFGVTSITEYWQTNAQTIKVIASPGYGRLYCQPSANGITQTMPAATVNVQGNLVIGNSTNTGTLAGTATTTLSVLGSILINANGTFNAANINTFCGINWTNNGTFTPGTKTVTFNGSGNQAINGSSATQTFYNVIVDNQGGILSTNPGVTSINTNNITLAVTNVGTFTSPATLNLNALTTSSITLAGGTFTAGSLITIRGNWTNNGGTFNHNNGLVQFVLGTNPQNINGTANTQSFYDLEINKSAGVVNVSGSTTTLNITNNFTQTAFGLNASGLTTLNIGNNFTITSGTFTPCNNIYVGGNIVRNGGTLTWGTNVTLNGSVQQSISGTSAIPNFTNLTVNNTFPVTAITLNTPITANGIFTLTDGHVVTDAVNILTLGANATVVTPSSRPASDSTFVRGPMINTVATTLAVTKYFPVGKDNISHYAELNITHAAVTSTKYTGEYINSSASDLGWTLPGTIERVSNIGHWNINKGAGANAVSAYVNLYYLDSYDGVTDYNNLKVAKGDPNSWSDIGGTPILDGFGFPIGITSIVNFTTFSRFSLANGLGGTNPLPINLLSLTATCNSRNVLIKWVTASETNNSYFTIEKSYDGNKFTPISTVDGAGTTTQTTLYSLTDENAFDKGNILYYRLKQTDYDGKSSTSEVVAVQCSQNVIDYFRVGTSANEIIVYFSGNEGTNYNISLFDNLGRIVSNNMLNITAPNIEFPINISSFPQGTYNLVVSSDSYIKSKQIIILK